MCCAVFLREGENECFGFGVMGRRLLRAGMFMLSGDGDRCSLGSFFLLFLFDTEEGVCGCGEMRMRMEVE
jgi:hypothetical protein